MPDPIFAEPRLAAIDDALDADRSDLAHYIAIVEEFGARRVLDVGYYSTLRFRSRGALIDSLVGCGFQVDEIRDAPDRPGSEFVFVARSTE